jgi:hypothetical protein
VCQGNSRISWLPIFVRPLWCWICHQGGPTICESIQFERLEVRVLTSKHGSTKQMPSVGFILPQQQLRNPKLPQNLSTTLGSPCITNQVKRHHILALRLSNKFLPPLHSFHHRHPNPILRRFSPMLVLWEPPGLRKMTLTVISTRNGEPNSKKSYARLSSAMRHDSAKQNRLRILRHGNLR